MTLGSTCRDMTCQWPPPSALARSMYGRDSTARVCARTSRAVVGQVVTPIARMIVPSERDITVASAIASTSVGITRNQSVIRIITVANQPRKCPAVMPISAPIATERTAASRPDSEGDPGAPHQQAEQSAPELVGAQRELAARALHGPPRRVGHALHVDRRRVSGAAERDQREQREGGEAEEPGPVGAVPRQKRAAERRRRARASEEAR